MTTCSIEARQDQQWITATNCLGYMCRGPIPKMQIASMVALVDFTEANGVTRVVPGSHREDSDLVKDPDEIARVSVPAEMSARSAVISRLHAPRRGSEHDWDQWRRGCT